MIRVRLKKQLQSAGDPFNLDVDFELGKGESFSLFGESGAGKTSILRMIAGLMKPDEGFVKIGERVLFDSESGKNLKSNKRNVAFLFQHFALFPNMTVLENIKYARPANSTRSINEVLKILELQGFESRHIDTLSAGQKQRVALARCIAQEADILLLDEPLSSLDGKMRFELQNYINNLREEYNLSMILVSHDVSELVRLSDKTGILKEGKIEKTDSPLDLFAHGNISAKFRFTGKIVKIEKQDFLKILYVMIGKDLVKVVDDSEDLKYEIGEEILIASKAFNPIIQKIKT